MTPPDAFSLTHQARWETEGFRRAMESYHKAVALAVKQGREHELAPAKALLRQIVPGLIEAIKSSQAEGEGHIASKAGRPPLWSWPIQLLPADKLAVIALTTCLRGIVTASEDDIAGMGASVTACSQSIAAAVRVQIEYDNWAGENPDVEKRLRRRFPKVDRRVWSKWRRKVEALRLEEWPEGQAVALGAHLIHLVCQVSPDRLTVETRSLTGGRTQRFLQPTQATVDLMADVTARAEVARPLLMPMVIPPVKWRYEERRDGQAAA